MKTKSKLFIALGVFFALAVGFFIGLSVEYPKVDNNDISGTITKIKNYRNSQSEKTDIQIQNELVSDTVKLKSVQKFLDYNYLTAVKMANDLQFAIKVTNSNDAFKASNKVQIENITNYEKYLSFARTDLLLAISTCQKPENVDPQLFKELLNQANNVIAQMNYKNRIVIDFIDNLAAFSEKNNKDISEELKKVHDVLVLNEINSALITSDKTLLNSFGKKSLLTNGENLVLMDAKNMSKIVSKDIENLGLVNDSEKFGWLDKEKLQVLMWDNEKLEAGILDADKLDCLVALDVEKLGTFMINDQERMGQALLLDVNKLGSWDSEKLGLLDSEILSHIELN